MFTLLITRNAIYVRNIQEGISTSIASITIEDIKEKLYKLRTQYKKKSIKVRSSSRIGVGLDDVHKSRLWFYEKISFLDGNELKSTK